MNLILASASPRRRELIKKIGDLEVEICPSNMDEKTEQTDPVRYAISLAKSKATDVFNRKGGVVLGADTIVVLDGEILGKPHSYEEANAMFIKLCGRTHEVVTGLGIVSANLSAEDAEISYVTFGDYDEALVKEYIASGAPFDKAGGYGIQDDFLRPLIKDVKGDFDNVIGLPVKKVEEMLKQFRR